MIFGFGKKKDDDGTNQREHSRVGGNGEKVRMYGDEYDVGDLSEGGLRLVGFDDTLNPGQYLEFHLTYNQSGEEHEIRGHAQVVRRWDDNLAVKFTQPQPDLVFAVRDYIQSTY